MSSFLVNEKIILTNNSSNQDAFDRLPTLKYEVIKLTADDEQVFMEYIRHVDGEDDLSVGEVLQIENGLIIFSRVYHG